MAALEARLKARLFHRSTRGVTPTDVGAAYYDKCKAIAAQLEEADNLASLLQSKVGGQLRINTSVAASSFPNGRALTDDVTDVALRVIAGATAFTPEFNIAPNNQLGDGVDANDKPFLSTFPYVGTPENGY